MFAKSNSQLLTIGEREKDETRLQDWRRSAQQVTRAWNAWIAAEGRERSSGETDDGRERYRAFVSALAEEERAAAEIERMLRPAESSVTGALPSS